MTSPRARLAAASWRRRLSFAVAAAALVASPVVPSMAVSASRPHESLRGAASTIGGWEISRSLPGARIDRGAYPRFFLIFAAGWEPVEASSSGSIDIARHRTWEPGADLVFARTIVRTDRARRIELAYGSAGRVDLFVNGMPVAPQSAERASVGLEAGLNEIFFMVEGTAAAWTLAVTTDSELDRPIKEHRRLTKAWETAATFLTPESVQYDPRRNLLYVSSFDVNYTATPELTGFISRLGLDGEVLDLHWVDGLEAPTGMGIYGDRLYVLERRSLAEIDPDTGAVVARYTIPGVDFPNDLAVGEDGSIYITDTRPSSPPDSRVYRFKDGVVAIWLDSLEIDRANGLFVHDGRLLVGNTGDGSLKAVDLDTGAVDKIVTLGAGVVDGIRAAPDGSYLVSHWEGQVYVVSPAGEVVEVLDTLPGAVNNTADFEFITDSRLLVIPTFLGNRVIAYRLSDAAPQDARRDRGER